MTVQDETNLINLATLTDIYNLKRGTINAWAQRGYFDEFFLYKKKHQFFYKRAEICKYVEDRIKLMNKTRNKKIDGSEKTESASEDDSENPTLSESKAKKEKYLAYMAELEYEEKIKTFIKMKSVKKVFSILCKITKHNLTAIPGRIAAELASMTDIKEIEERVLKEINDVLKEMAESDYKAN